MKDLTNYSAINTYKQAPSNSKLSQVYFSGMELDSTKNIDSTVFIECASGSNQVSIVGTDYSGYTGLLIVDNEVMNVTSTVVYSTYSTMSVRRAVNFSVASTHLVGSKIRSARLMDTTTTWTINEKTEVSNSNLFAPVISTSSVELFDNVNKYSYWSDDKIIDIQTGKYVYIFQGIHNQVLRTYLGYISEFYTTLTQNKVNVECQDKLMKYFDKDCTTVKTYKTQDINLVLSGLLDIPVTDIVFANGLNISDFNKVDYISTKDYKTYGEVLGDLCKSLCFRLKFNCYEQLVISQDLNKTNLNTYIATSPIVTHQGDLMNIDFEGNKSLIINDISCTYKDRKTLYNIADFQDDDGTKRYLKAEFFISPIVMPIIIPDGVSDYTYYEKTITLGANIKYLQIGDYIILKDANNGNEFVGYVTTITVDPIPANNTFGFICGFEKDRTMFATGRMEWLTNNSYHLDQTFLLYYSFNELPYCWSLQYGEITSNLEIPLIPGVPFVVNGKFGAVENNDQKFCGIVEEIDHIYDRSLTNTQLKYNQDYGQ